MNPALPATVPTLLLRLPKVPLQLLLPLKAPLRLHRQLKVLLRLHQPLKALHRPLPLPKVLLRLLTLRRQNDSQPLCGPIIKCSIRPRCHGSGVFFGTTEFVALKLHDAAGVKATDQLPQHRSINQTT